MLNRKAPYLLLQEDTPPQLSVRSQGTLGHLIRNRSHGSIASYGSTWRGPGNGGAADNTPDLEAALPDTMASHSHVHSVHADYVESPRRPPSEERRLSAVLNSAGVRSMRLIGASNPRYRWAKYWKTEEQLSSMKKPIREYYERTNYLIQQYLYIDKLLDSSLPHDLLNEYNNLPASHFRGVEVPDTICEEPTSSLASRSASRSGPEGSIGGGSRAASGVGTPLLSDGSNGRSENGETAVSKKVKRTPKDIYRATETTPFSSKRTTIIGTRRAWDPSPRSPGSRRTRISTAAPASSRWLSTSTSPPTSCCWPERLSSSYLSRPCPCWPVWWTQFWTSYRPSSFGRQLGSSAARTNTSIPLGADGWSRLVCSSSPSS